jgi:hypothetical protein
MDGDVHAPPFEEIASSLITSQRTDLWECICRIGGNFKNREADLAWPERSKGTWVPAYEEAASSFSSPITLNN